MSSTRTRITYSISSSSFQEMEIVTKEEISPSLDSALVVGGLSMILYEPNNFMHVRLNPSLIFYLELTKVNVSTTITGGAKSFLVPCGHTQLWPCCQNQITLRQGCVLDSRMRQLKMAGYDCLTKTFCFWKGDGSWKGRRSSEVRHVVIQLRTVILFRE